MRRFYEAAHVEAIGDGFAVALDGKPVRTPARHRLTVDRRALAEALAAEWAAQAETIERETMPLTRLVCAAIDLLPDRRDEVIDEVVRYAETDLVCYRVTQPTTLAERQSAAWQPLVAWVDRRYGAALAVTTELTPVAQSTEAVAALRRAVQVEGDVGLVGLSFATKTLGSVVMALALREGEIGPRAAWTASVVDEIYQIERWGPDQELEARMDRLERDIADVSRLFSLLRA